MTHNLETVTPAVAQNFELTKKLAVTVIDGKVPQSPRHGSNHTVVTMSQ